MSVSKKLERHLAGPDPQPDVMVLLTTGRAEMELLLLLMALTRGGPGETPPDAALTGFDALSLIVLTRCIVR